MKKLILSTVLAATTWFVASSFIGKEKDYLHDKTFECNHQEMKDGVAKGKSVPGEFLFKSGKVYMDLANEKFGTGNIRYNVLVDSTATDETGTEVRIFTIEADDKDKEGARLLLNATVTDYEIDGTIKYFDKKDKLKKMYEFTGKEKVKKGKK